MILQRLKLFFTFFDSRWEDIDRANWGRIVYRDFSAGLIVALTAIPMAMGFAMAMGLRPEQGIIAGALACAVGRTFGGSKYQVYGPTAAFIPIIAALISKYGEASGGSLQEAHGFLVLVSVIAGVILMLMGVFGLGKYAKLVPNSIVVGFTAGIAVVIAMTNFKEILGVTKLSDLLVKQGEQAGDFFSTLAQTSIDFSQINIWAVAIGLGTFALTKILLRISIFIPAPLLAISLSTLLSATVLNDKGIKLIGDVYGSIPNNFFQFTPPIMPDLTTSVMIDIVFFVLAIVFVSGVESLLCSSMADRLADNRKTPFNPDKEFWGQGLVQVIVPLVNGFPCTGALARTATSIKAGAVTPLAGYFKAFLKLALAYYIAEYLEMVPMACIGGILLWVASNMFKPAEIKQVLEHNKFHASLMTYTAVMVPLTDFLTGVLSALILYAILFKFLDKTPAHAHQKETAAATLKERVNAAGKFGCVNVLLAMNEEDAEILRYAANLAKHGISSEFHFIHTLPPKKPPYSNKELAEIKARIQQEVDDYFDTSRNDLTFQSQVFNSVSHIDNLIEYIVMSNTDLVLLGHRKQQIKRRSLAAHLAMVTKASVWVVPENAKPEITRIVAPIDFSPASADSLSHATALAKMYGLKEVVALHIYFDEVAVRYDEHIEQVEWQEAKTFENFLATVETHGVSVKPVFMEGGNAAHAILYEKLQLNADLLVISTHGRSRSSTILLGDTAEQIIRDTSIPTLAIKHDGNYGLLDALAKSRFWAHSELVRAN